MLITQLKSRETLTPIFNGKTVIINCYGCKEVYFPEEEAKNLQKELSDNRDVIEVFTRDYICNPEHLNIQLKKYEEQIKDADAVVVFSCGVGVQTVSEQLDGKRVFAGCDTYPLPGFQGVTPLEVDCDRCGECYLNLTGAICPITACSKSLLNGQCGGSKNGKCEVNKEMDCGWELIYRKLQQLNKLDTLSYPAQVRNYARPFENNVLDED